LAQLRHPGTGDLSSQIEGQNILSFVFPCIKEFKITLSCKLHQSSFSIMKSTIFSFVNATNLNQKEEENMD
jgi:hypothetical protein